jgi:hypothetical protein
MKMKMQRDTQFLSHVEKEWASKWVEWEIGEYEVAKSNDDDGEKGKTVEHYLLFCQFLCVFRHCSQNDDDEWVYDKCTQKYILLSPLLPTVVAQSYKIDVEILAAPRGTLYMKIKIIYDEIEFKIFFTSLLRLYRNSPLCHTDFREGARSCSFMGSRACIFHLSLTSRR